MDVSKVLLLLLDLFFFLMLFFFFLGAGFIAYVSYVDDLPLYMVSTDGVEDFNYRIIFRLLADSISYLIFVAIVFFLRKGVRIMVNDQLFSSDVVKYINVAGILLCVMSVVTVILNFGKDLSKGFFKIELDPFDWKSGFFMVIIGLFLMLTSRVIKEGVELKSENELTI